MAITRCWIKDRPALKQTFWCGEEMIQTGGVLQEERYGGNPTSHTPAHNVPAVAAAFRL
jgi:hypothetical protein